MNKFALSSVAAAVMVAMSGAAVAAEKTGEVVFDKAGEQNVVTDVSVIANNKDAALILRNGADVTYTGGTLNFTNTNSSSGQPTGIRVEDHASDNTTLNLGGKDSKIHVKVGTENGLAIGLVARNSGNKDAKAPVINVKGSSLVIESHSDHYYAYGLLAQNTSQNEPREFATVNVDSDNTVIKVTTVDGHASGILVFSEAKMNINGNLEVWGDDAISARGGSVLNINQSNTKTVKLNGDINFSYASNSKTPVDADVNVNLSGPNSYWNGNAVVEWEGMADADFADKSKLTVTGLNVGLSDGAQWTPTVVINADSEDKQNKHEGQNLININQMTMNDGVINITKDLVDAKQDVTLDKVVGTGGTINTYVDQAKDGAETVSKVNIKAVEDGKDAPAFNVVASNVNADTMSDKTLKTLGGAVKVEGDNAKDTTITATVNEGAVNGAVSQDFNAKGEAVGDKVEAKNTKLDAYSSVFTLGAVTWRHDMNDLTKRMGELRMSPNKVGSWVRVYGSELNYGAQNVTAKQNSVQVGGDYDLGNGWKVGGAFSYTDGNSTYHSGEADNKAYGFAAYGTWFAENGQFVDLIAKYSRLSNDFTLGDMAGDYDNNAFSVSAEYGWHFRLNDVAFVEPQAELTYGRIMGDDFTTSNGVRMAQEDFDSLIGRLGVRAGFYFPKDRGTIYARASVLHDFQGEAESKATLASNAKVSQTLKDDLGGTWYEFGLGANFNLTDATYVYVDLERTNAGKVVEDYRWNCGIRHAF